MRPKAAGVQMGDSEKARLLELRQRQERKRRTPAVLRAWNGCGVVAAALAQDRQEEVASWLRQRWRAPTEPVANLHDSLASILEGEDLAILMDFWEWGEAVAVLVPSAGLLRTKDRLREIYPEGFLVVNQHLSRALLVDFDDHSRGAEIALIS
jgi:hypothetical protein